MKITFLSVAQADAILAQPLEMGLHKHLADRTRKTVQQHHERIYGCRHCTQVRPTGTIADEAMEAVEPTPLPAEATEPDAATSAPAWRTQAWHDAKAEPKVVLRDYNALRSHCKAKCVRPSTSVAPNLIPSIPGTASRTFETKISSGWFCDALARLVILSVGGSNRNVYSTRHNAVILLGLSDATYVATRPIVSS
jgi:hypothetical protein